MSVKSKIMNAMIAHPKLVTFAIGLGITMAIGTAIGMLDHSHMAQAASHANGGDANGFAAVIEHAPSNAGTVRAITNNCDTC